MTLLGAWAALLSILTSLVVIFGSQWAYNRPTEQHRPEPKVLTIQPIPTLASPRQAGASIPDMILGAAKLCGVSPRDFYRLVVRESSMRHWGANGKVLRSRSNAYGLAQVKIGTAKLVSPRLNVMKPWDNLIAGACYYRQMLDRFGGDSHRALVAYHNGPNGGRTPHAVRYANDILGGAR